MHILATNTTTGLVGAGSEAGIAWAGSSPICPAPAACTVFIMVLAAVIAVPSSLWLVCLQLR